MNAQIMQNYDKLMNLTNTFKQEYHTFDYFMAKKNASEPVQVHDRIQKDISAMKEVVMNFYKDCCRTRAFDDFVTFFTMYCNHYIKYGLSCLTEDSEQTMFGLKKSAFQNQAEPVLQSYLEEIYTGIVMQEYAHFEHAVSINEKFSIAHLYLFVKNAVNFFYTLEVSEETGHVDAIRSELMQHYAALPASYAEYVMSKGKYYHDVEYHGISYNGHGDDLNVLPHISFKNEFDIISENVLTHYASLQIDQNKELQYQILDIVQGLVYDEEKRKAYFFLIDALNNLYEEVYSVPHMFFEGGEEDFGSKSEFYAVRVGHLHLFNSVKYKNGNKSLEQIFISALKMEQAKNDRAKVVQEFSHTYKNMRATQLGNVAKALLAMDDSTLKKYGRQVLLEYGIKQNITKAAEMLQLRFEDKGEEILRRVRDAMSSKDNNCHIENLLSEAFRRCLITLLHDGSDTGKRFRKAFLESESDFDLISIRNEFEEQTLFEEYGNTFAWFSEKIFSVSLQIADEWKSLYFLPENYAAIVLIDILAELTANMFKYGDKTKPCSFSFNSDESALIITVQNYADKKFLDSHGTQAGLTSMAETVGILNQAVGFTEDSVITHQEGEIFSVSVRISKAIFQID